MDSDNICDVGQRKATIQSPLTHSCHTMKIKREMDSWIKNNNTSEWEFAIVDNKVTPVLVLPLEFTKNLFQDLSGNEIGISDWPTTHKAFQ